MSTFVIVIPRNTVWVKTNCASQVRSLGRLRIGGESSKNNIKKLNYDVKVNYIIYYKLLKVFGASKFVKFKQYKINFNM